MAGSFIVDSTSAHDFLVMNTAIISVTFSPPVLLSRRRRRIMSFVECSVFFRSPPSPRRRRPPSLDCSCRAILFMFENRTEITGGEDVKRVEREPKGGKGAGDRCPFSDVFRGLSRLIVKLADWVCGRWLLL